MRLAHERKHVECSLNSSTAKAEEAPATSTRSGGRYGRSFLNYGQEHISSSGNSEEAPEKFERPTERACVFLDFLLVGRARVGIAPALLTGRVALVDCVVPAESVSIILGQA